MIYEKHWSVRNTALEEFGQQVRLIRGQQTDSRSQLGEPPQTNKTTTLY